MIQMGKKGITYLKTIEKAMVGLRECNGGEVILIRLDEFEVYISDDKAESLANQLTARVRKLRDNRERDEREKKAAEEAAKTQKELPLPEQK